MKEKMNPTQSVIPGDHNLLKLMMQDSKMAPEIYRPGPYWEAKSEVATREIYKLGIDDFRGSSNSIATSYADSAYIDVRGQYNHGIRSLLSIFSRRAFPFSKIFDAQVNLTKSRFQSGVDFKNQIANSSIKFRELLSKYNVPNDTIRGGCLDYCEIDGKKIANHYLAVLNTHDIISKHIDFSSARSFFEIGGGFGINVHLLIENYKNLKKIIYLDIPPNLYVGTQYLKSFYGNSIKTYAETKELKKIEFNDDDELEVFCIAPYQIENLNAEVNIFQNCHSFVEMPSNVVKNYAKHIERLTDIGKSSIALVSYDCFDLNTTFNPDCLPDLFTRKFQKLEYPQFWSPSRKDYYYISKSL
jgi:putative sugar O-methyltransferase